MRTNLNVRLSSKALISLFFLTTVALITGCSSGKETMHLPGSPVEFEFEKSDKPEVYATYNKDTVSVEQITSQNPVYKDFKNQENMIRLEFILRKFVASTQKMNDPELDLYLPEAAKSPTELAKSWGLVLNPKAKIQFKKTPPDKDVIAQWGDQQVRAQDVEKASVRLALIKSRAFHENLNRLKGILVRRALLDAAHSEKLEIDGYIKKHILSDSKPATEAEFESFLNQSNIKRADITKEQTESLQNVAMEKRDNTLIEQYVVKNLMKGTIKVHEFPPAFQVKVPGDWETLWGVSDAPISVLYFGDLVCGPCRQALDSVIKVQNDYNGHIRTGFHFLFSSNDRDSRMVAEAALCTHSQGKKYFKKFAEVYATNPPGVDETSINDTVQRIGANTEEFKKCFLSRQHQALLNQHLDFSGSMGVSQPAVLVDGEPLEGVISQEDLREIIDRKVQTKSSTLGAFWRRMKSAFTAG